MNKMKIYKISLVLVTLILVCLTQEIIKVHNEKRQIITFGSCNKFYRNHQSNIFYDVAQKNPDVWIWLGDVAYIDDMILPGIWTYESNPIHSHAKMQSTKNDPAYQELLKKVNAEIGVWDDHDYGSNNSGESFKHKNQMRKVWLDFFNEPAESPRRTRTSGIYASYYLGESKRIKIILTDDRWNRKNNDILGEDQWKWLESELNDSQVEFFILGSGSQFLPDDRFIPESWDIGSKERLYKLINKTGSSVIIISGDVHFGEIMEHPCSQKKVGYRLCELTSSGISFDIDSIGSGSFHFGERFVFTPTYNKLEDRFVGKNYGVVDVEWNEENILQSVIKLQIFTEKVKEPVLEKVILLREIRASNKPIDSSSGPCVVDDIPAFQRWKSFAITNLLQVLSEPDYQIIWLVVQKLTIFSFLIGFWIYLIKSACSRKTIQPTKEKQL